MINPEIYDDFQNRSAQIQRYFQSFQSGIFETESRCQSTPAMSQFHCVAVKVQTASPICGQTKLPLCSRRWHSHTPVPSHINNFNRLFRRFRKAYADPSLGDLPSDCCTHNANPSAPTRMSTGSIAHQIMGGSGITIAAPSVPPTSALIHRRQA
jgi:hypothetical protein